MVIAMNRSLPCLLLTLLIGLVPALTQAAEPTLEQQRDDFLAAEHALSLGALARFHALAAELRDYPLYPYLRYQYLRPRLAQSAEAEIRAFIRDHGDSPLAGRLQHAWIETLARRGQWDTLLRNFPAHSDSVTLDCYRRQALLQTDAEAQALDGIESLWLVGYSRPRACDPLFSAWRAQDGLSSELAWQRFRLAMQSNEISLARYLTRYMNDSHQAWSEQWLQVHRNPRLITNAQRPAINHPAHDDILTHGISRMARSDIDQAIAVWDKAVGTPAALSREYHADIERNLAMVLALRSHPQALERLDAIDNAATDASLREWRVRTALARQDWAAVLNAIDQLRDDERDDPSWHYWRARALEALDRQVEANDSYHELAQNRGYYSFLAADRAGLPYRLNHQAVDREIAAAVTPETYPGLARARELLQLDRMLDARREWFFATRHMADWQLQSAAVIAHGWGWHDRAVITVAQTDFRDDLELRFPLVYPDQVSAAADRHGINPALAFALIRQESAFDRRARSPAGALGLMQLMPATASRLARLLERETPNQGALLDVDTNLDYGMAWLRRLLDRYNNPAVALAAYNAGEHRVDGWLPQDRMISADIWIDTIPFRETRAYIRNIMLFTTIYEQHLKLPGETLTQRMPVVVPRDALITHITPVDETATAPLKDSSS